MAVAKKTDSIMTPIGESIPEAQRGALRRLNDAITEHNIVNEDEADIYFFMNDMILRYALFLESENEKTKAPKGGEDSKPKQRRNVRQQLHAVAQSA